MDARKNQTVDSLLLANGKYTVNISQRGENYVVNLERIGESEKHKGRPHKLQVVKDEIAEPVKRGRGRPKRDIAVMETQPLEKRRGRPPKLQIVRDEIPAEPKKRGRPAKSQIIAEPVKRGRGRPKKTA